MDQGGGHHFAVALGLLDGDHAFGATAVAGVFGDRGAFAVAVFGGREDALCFVARHQHGDHALMVFDHHAADSTSAATQGANIVFVKAHGLATVTEQHHIVLAVGQSRSDQEIAFVQVHSDDAALARVAEFVERGLLDGAHGRGHEHILVVREGACFAGQGQHHVDFFAFLQREHVDDGASA